MISIQDILDIILDQRGCLCRGILLLTYSIRNDHVIKTTIKKNTDKQDRNSDGDHQYNGDLSLKLQITICLTEFF